MLHKSHILLKVSLSLTNLVKQKDLSPIGAKILAPVTVCGLKELRNDSNFSEFWMQITAKANELVIGEPTLPHKR